MTRPFLLTVGTLALAPTLLTVVAVAAPEVDGGVVVPGTAVSEIVTGVGR
ncbi:hypothetical protein SAMN05443574_101103 [Haloarcula vallismortis]|uniref:Uncharacterized protein n=1 Tax=Haloarcula vallismortis TaxID=28442 RepID=A0A1H2Q766_HALVA|nr:hypothetical protein [Haloarcula vallismortis]SDW03026.1 hypothetical protein SAMN05443574_101103 [Haloarcula vallismortis]